jgi:hypothetical protein
VGVALSALLAALLAVAAFAALLMVAYRRVLRRRLTEELLKVSGPSIVRALLPQQVMATFLSEIYGDSEANRDVVAGVLGGEGTEPHGADLTISTHTTVDYELRAVDHHTYQLISTLTYSFKENVTDHRFVIFSTCDPLLRDSITLACQLALFESWFVPDQSLFEQSVDAMLPSVNIGIRYTDLDSRRHEVALGRVELTEVGYRDWPEYLTFFRGPVGRCPARTPRNTSERCESSSATSASSPMSTTPSVQWRTCLCGQRVWGGSTTTSASGRPRTHAMSIASASMQQPWQSMAVPGSSKLCPSPSDRRSRTPDGPQ